MSYSQRTEEAEILKACAAIERGTFLDIGAWNLVQMSNTRALWERGWTGVVVEPSPGPVRNMMTQRDPTPNDPSQNGYTIVAAAVGLEPGLRPLQISDDALSAEQPDPLWQKRGGFIGELVVPFITLEQIANQFGGFDFISIDTEGTSVDLFKRALEIGWRPTCLCVEHNDRIVEAAQVAQAAGYALIHTTEENLIWAR